MAVSFTASDKLVFEALVRAARNGRACPTNNDLCGILGAASTSSSVNALARLQKQGRIIVTRFQTGREVFIPSLGIGTAPYSGKRSAHWRERADGEPKLIAPRRMATKPVEPAAEERHVRLHRDPCFRCGVRADIGCAHRPASIAEAC